MYNLTIKRDNTELSGPPIGSVKSSENFPKYTTVYRFEVRYTVIGE